MRAGVIGAIAGALVTAAVFLSNPDAEAHRDAIRAQTAADSPLAAAIGLGTLKGLVVEYHSAGFVSWTTREERVMTFGALGNVWITAKD